MENSSATITGILYVVATPIGNLEDMTNRAINTLKTVDAVLAEDTRHSLQLFNALGISKPLISMHAHNETDKCADIIHQLEQGKSLALISDAGTPLISDPGFVLVRAARQKGIRIVPIPGACALTTALCAAGVPCDNFVFVGFLPAKQQARQTRLQDIRNNLLTTIIYESTHRIIDCLDDIAVIYGDNYELVLAKEITKSFEHFMQATAADIKAWLLGEKGRTNGEFVIILPAEQQPENNLESERILHVLMSELPLKQAVKIAAQLSDMPKNDLYKKALELNKK